MLYRFSGHKKGWLQACQERSQFSIALATHLHTYEE